MNDKKYDRPNLSNAYKRTVDLIDTTVNGSNAALLDAFGDELRGWLSPEHIGRGKTRKVKNPLSNRFLNRTGKRYLEIFKGIKLKTVTYDKIQNYKTIDYEVDNYCVPSYLKTKLRKKEYAKISDELDRIKTPTYPELTKI